MSETYKKMKEDLNTIVEDAIKETEEKYMKLVKDIVDYIELGHKLANMITMGASYEQYKDLWDKRQNIEHNLSTLKYFEIGEES